MDNGLLDTILHPHHDKPAWTNWAKNQSCHPTEIFNPETLEELTKIVFMAKADGKKIRCAASGHSWSSSSVTDGYLVVVNKMEKVHTPIWDNDLKSWTVRIETGVLVKDLDDKLRQNDPPLTLPSNVVLDSVSALLYCCSASFLGNAMMARIN
jgi:FAD/FMN-containing dehydrogenase